MTNLEIVKPITCKNCQLTINSLEKACPRCAKPINLRDRGERALTTAQAIKLEAGSKEFTDLLLMLDNWSDAYVRLMNERGCDWSSPHEFFQEFVEHMCAYIQRLRNEGYATPERMISIGDKLVESLHKIILKCEQEEDLLRLTGMWTDMEQEIKEYWKIQTEKLVCQTRQLIGG